MLINHHAFRLQKGLLNDMFTSQDKLYINNLILTVSFSYSLFNVGKRWECTTWRLVWSSSEGEGNVLLYMFRYCQGLLPWKVEVEFFCNLILLIIYVVREKHRWFLQWFPGVQQAWQRTIKIFQAMEGHQTEDRGTIFMWYRLWTISWPWGWLFSI